MLINIIKMICQHLLFAFLIISVSKISSSLPVKEKITPVDLKFYCVTVKGAEEKIQDKVPVLLIHGLGGSHKSWDGVNLHLSLSTKRKVCSVDLRNHGDSPWNNRNDVKALAADIGRFLDKEGIKKVNIIGHSLGGKVAVHYTLNNPNRVNSIVVEDMRPNSIMEKAYNQILVFFKLLNDAMTTVPSGVTEDKARDVIISFLNKKSDELGVTRKSLEFLELKKVDDKWSFKHNMDVILKTIKDPKKFLGKSYGVYKRPALFIYGVKSPFKVGQDKNNILKMFPKAKLIPVEDAGHVIHGEFRKFDDEVVKFLNEVN